MRRIVHALLAVAVLVISAQQATAQVIRITSNAAAIRVGPAETAEVITTPKVGSIFDVSSTSGDWFAILMPADKQGLRRYGYILQRQAEVVSGLASVPSSPAGTSTGAASPPAAPVALAPDWAERLRQARARKAGGRAKLWSGVGMLASGGALLAVIFTKMFDPDSRNCTDANPCYEYAWGLGAGAGLLVTGGVLFGRGGRQIDAANRELIRLETERINAQPRASLVLPLRKNGDGLQPDLTVVLGDGVEVAARLNW